MKALVGTFNQQKALVGAFSVIVKTNGSFAALLSTLPNWHLFLLWSTQQEALSHFSTNRSVFFLQFPARLKVVFCPMGVWLYTAFNLSTSIPSLYSLEPGSISTLARNTKLWVWTNVNVHKIPQDLGGGHRDTLRGRRMSPAGAENIYLIQPLADIHIIPPPCTVRGPKSFQTKL